MIHVKRGEPFEPAPFNPLPIRSVEQRVRSGIHRIEEGLIPLRCFTQLAEQEFDGIHRAHRIEDAAQHIHLLENVWRHEQLFLAGARAVDVDRREDTLVGHLAVENDSKITSSIREPVSMSAVAIMVSEPPSSMLRAAPKKRFGRCNAFASTPPVKTLPDEGTTVL